MKKWNILYKNSVTCEPSRQVGDPVSVEKIKEVLLQNRGLHSEKEIEEFLDPKLSDISFDSVGINKDEVDKAVKRIKKAMKDHESIAVYTDYDVDGITSGALVWETLYLLGAHVMPYVPHRVDEGYGLSKIGIDRVKKDFKADLIITVDHGITAYEKIEYARSLGIDTIIIDHHLIPKNIPKSIACVHTTKLVAAGIAWLFSDHLLRKISKQSKEQIDSISEKNLELAALGTVADLIPLLGPNRTITKFGLVQLRKTKRIGLNQLFQESAIKQDEIDTYTISHMIAPRINAVGRMTHALDALRLLCTKDKDRAFDLASHLGVTNKERQTLTQDSFTHALDVIKNDLKTEKKLQKILIVHHVDYQQGIIGLIAGKLTEIFTRPSVAISMGEIYSKASARSVAGFNIVKAFEQLSDILVDVGGHPMAAGFTIETKNIDSFKMRLTEIAEKEIDEELLKKVITIDTEIDFSMISKTLYDSIQSLAPFGVGNREPVFATMNVHVVGARLVGREGKHIKLTLMKDKQMDAIGFGMGEIFPKLEKDTYVDIAYTIDENTWNGSTRLQLKLKDVRIAEKNETM
jgi:single-stranded-DNA-specific exonuclease